MSALGIDIGSQSIKLVQLDRHGAGFSMLAAGITPTPPGALEADNEESSVKLSEAIKKLVADTKVTDRQVNVSLPEDKTFTRLIKLPYLTDQEIDSAISWQAEPYIPIPIAEANIDYQVISRTPPTSEKPGSIETLLVAAPKTVIAKYLKIMNLSSLSVLSIEPELLSLARSLAPAQGTVLLVDFGATSTNIGVARNGSLVISHSISTGGNVLTRAVSASLSVNTSQAEEYKKTYGLSNALEGRVASSLEPVVRVIADEMKKAIQYYSKEVEEGGKSPVSSIVLSGGLAYMPEFIGFLSQNLGLEVLIGDPMARLSNDAKVDKAFSSYSAFYGVAIGLAENI